MSDLLPDCVELLIKAKEKDLGDNFVVRRSLPNIERRMVGPFIFWDHMGPVEIGPKPEGGEREMMVRSHPHIGLSTITYLFSGEILHRDSLGNELPIRPGEVNWMTAGNGITHSERARSPEAPQTLEGIQLWLALPRDAEEIDASFVHKKEDSLPMVQAGDAQLRLIAGSFLGAESPLPVFSPLFYLAHDTASDNGMFKHSFAAAEEAAVYVVTGEATVNGQSFEGGNLLVLKNGANLELSYTAGTRFMVFGGEALSEKRHIWWNFVSSSKERIEQAKKDWSEGRFKPTINETDTIPLPPV